MSDVLERVNARLTAMEAAAKAATQGPWEHLAGHVGKPTVSRADALGRVTVADRKADAAHIALNDPAAVLALVAGLRAVVALAERWDRLADGNEEARGRNTKVAAYYRKHAAELRAAIAAMFPDPPEPGPVSSP